MLHFIVGIAGTGKTTNLIEKMRAGAERGDKLIYLVPEQYSFVAERQMTRKLGGKLALQVEVLSFTRLCNGVFRAYGGLAGVSLNKTAKHLLMSIATDEVRESLSVYRKSCANTAFLETLVETCSEFKTAGVTDAALSRFAKVCNDEALKRKLSELAVIYSAYQGLISRGYTDPDDDLIRACALLENNTYFGNKSVFIDGFTTFMAAEFEMLGHVITQANDVYFAVTADEVQDKQRGMGVFSAAKLAMSRLSRFAEKSGTPLAEPEILAAAHRFLRPELKSVAQGFMQPAAPVYEGGYSDCIELHAATDSYNELDYVAAEIKRLVCEYGCRYNEIAVVARDPAPFLRAVECAFSRHEIPYFMSASEDAENKPLASCLLSAINAVRSGFSSDSVLLFAKSPLLGLDAENIALLENYCYCWGIRGASWHMDFLNNPRGLADTLSEDDMAVLTRVNATRNAVIMPLLHLKEAMKKPDGKSFARGLFDLLTEIGAAENLMKYASGLERSDAFLDEAVQIWDTVIDVLDIFGTVLGGYKMAVAKLCELFRLAVNAAEIVSPPQTLDQVLVGGADRVRPEQIRAVFVIGANEGVFPAQLSGSGVFSDSERNALINEGLEISAPSLQKSVLEKYFAYFALTLPSEWLRVSYAKSDLKGRELLPSTIVAQLNEMFPHLPKRETDALRGISTESTAFDALAKAFREDSVFSATLREMFSKTEYGDLLSRMRHAYERPAHQIADEASARTLFGKFMRLSPTKVERFYKCPFSYFASEGLRLRVRGKVEFTGLEAGSVIHHVLQAMIQKHGGKGISELSDKQLSREIAEIIREYLAGRIDDMSQLPARLKFLFTRLNGLLTRLLRRLGEEFVQSEFEPAAFELPINTGGEVEPLQLETHDGTRVVVEGIVDRVDVMNKNGKRYIRVVDYKSGVKKFELNDVLYGLNMQMLLYLFTITENGKDSFSDAIPAGVLYMPAREKYISAARDSDAGSVQKAREKEWRMSGLLLEDEEALRGMERDIAGVFIPAKLDKSGKLSAESALASKAELGKLAQKVKRQIGEMAEELGKGKIAACPVEQDGRSVCEYCDYHAVCGFENGDRIKRVGKLDRAEIFKLLAKEEQNVGTGLDESAK